MMMQRKFLAAAVQAALLLALAPTSFAQDADASADEATTLDVVKVTARKREETLIEVPLAITAVSADRIEKLGIESINDIAKLTPGFSFRSAFGREGDRPVIRGQSNIQGESNAAFFIDGVFVNGNISGFGLDNLERVEVIRGPQAAQFGRRAFSGAINYITKRPTNDPEASVSATGATDSEREYSANISGAFVPDLLKFQFNARYYQFGGQYENYTNGVKDIGGQRTASAGGTLYFTPTDSWESTLRVNYTEDEDEVYPIGRLGDPENLRRLGVSGLTSVDFINNVQNCFRPTLTGATSNGFLAGQRPVSSTRSRGQICGDVNIPLAFGANTDRFRAAGFKPGLDRQRERISWSNDFTTEAGWTFNATSAYNKVESLSVVDQDYGGQSVFAFPFSTNGAFETVDFGVGKDYSQELRLSSPAESALRGSVGYYYYKERNGDGLTADMTTFRPATATTAAVLPVFRPTGSVGRISNRAFFGLIEYDWSEALTTTAELRLADDQIEISGRSTSTLAPTGTPATTRVVRNFARSASYDSILPRFTVKYALSDASNIYALAAKGNKPGGFNLAVESANLSDAARLFLTGQGLASFEEEKANTYEIGYKAELFDRSVSLSSALFLIDWDNQQLTESAVAEQINGTQTLTSYTTSIGESRVTGVELEADWRVTEQFSARFTFARTDAEIRDYFSQDVADLTGCGVASRTTGCGSAKGNDLPRVPKNQGSIALNFDSQLANGMGYFIRGIGAFEGSRFTQIENTTQTGSSFNLGLRAGLNLSDALSVTAFVRNATDDDTPEDVLRYINPSLGVCRPPIPGESVSTAICSGGLNGTNLRDVAITAPRKRQFGVTVNYKF